MWLKSQPVPTINVLFHAALRNLLCLGQLETGLLCTGNCLAAFYRLGGSMVYVEIVELPRTPLAEKLARTACELRTAGLRIRWL